MYASSEAKHAPTAETATPAPTAGTELLVLAEAMFASGLGEPVAADGDFSAVEQDKGLVLRAGDAITSLADKYKLRLLLASPYRPPGRYSPFCDHILGRCDNTTITLARSDRGVIWDPSI